MLFPSTSAARTASRFSRGSTFARHLLGLVRGQLVKVFDGREDPDIAAATASRTENRQEAIEIARRKGDLTQVPDEALDAAINVVSEREADVQTLANLAREHRMIFGSIEGVGGGLAGANLVRAPGMVVEGLSRYPGRAKAGYQGSMAAGDKASAARNAAADDYAAAAKEANDALLKKRAQAAASPPAPPTPVEPIAPPAIDPTAAAGNSPAARARRYMNTF
jgi:hypothetical protein